MPALLIRKVRTRQPDRHVGINEDHPSAFKVLDAWLPQSMTSQSCRGRSPNAKVAVDLSTGMFGVGLSAKSGGQSVKYNIGQWGESGSFAFLAICEFIDYTQTYSIVRLASTCVPVQIAAGNVRGVPWSPVDTARNYYGSIPGANKRGVLIANRVSQSTFELWTDGVKAVTTTALTGYGTTGGNPLCFMGTETNTELATLSVAKFYGGVAFKKGLTEQEIIAFSKNPWQLFAPEAIPLYWTAAGGAPQLLVPISDVSSGVWTPSAGSDLYAMLDEGTYSDADYIVSSSASTCEMRVTVGTDPVSSTGHILRYRLLAGTGTISASLKQGSTTIASYGPHTLTGAAQDFAQTLSGGEADSITDYSDLRVVFVSNG